MTLKQQLKALTEKRANVSASRRIKPGNLDDVLVLLALNLPELLFYGGGYFVSEPYTYPNLIVWQSDKEWLIDLEILEKLT